MITRRAVDLLAVLLAALVGIFAPAAVEATAIGLRNDGLAEASAATFIYHGSAVARVDVHSRAATGTAPALLSDAREKSASLPIGTRRTSTTFPGPLNATEAAPGARFVVNTAGEALDTAQVTIPNGKFGYLLENPSKSGVFADSMGFNQSSLDSALRSHLVDNFGSATPSVAMTGGGTKFSVTGPMVGRATRSGRSRRLGVSMPTGRFA